MNNNFSYNFLEQFFSLTQEQLIFHLSLIFLFASIHLNLLFAVVVLMVNYVATQFSVKFDV